MRKRCVLLALTLILSVFFACDLQIPNAVEVKGTPEFRVAANVNISGFIEETLDGLFFNSSQHIKILDCVETNIYTKIVYVKLFDQGLEFSNQDISNIQGYLSNNGQFTIGDHFDRINLFNNSITIPEMDLGSYLQGFTFSGYKTKLYISGADILDILTIKVNGDDFSGEKTNESGLNGLTNVYNEVSLPAGGIEVDLPVLDENVTSLNLEIYIGPDKVFKASMLDDLDIMLEIAVWLPFELKAGPGAKLELPDFFGGDGDLFGRENANSENPLEAVSDFIENLELGLILNQNPFYGAKLLVESRGINIQNTLSGNSFNIIISHENLSQINDPDNFPFAPKFSILFDPGAIVSLPRDFRATRIAFKAKISYKIDLAGGE